jgi:hypothetical protein
MTKKQMTDQEVFDKVARALMTQGEASVPANYDDTTGTCRYRIRRGTRTLKCAVGHLLPARLYDKTMEGVNAETVVFGGEYEGRRFEDISGECGLQGVSQALLTDLQSAHDGGLAEAGFEVGRRRMRRVAKTYSLNDSVLEN